MTKPGILDKLKGAVLVRSDITAQKSKSKR